MAATPEPPSRQPTPLRRPGLLRFSAVELLVSLVVLFVSSAFLEYLRYGDVYEGLLMTVVMILAVLAVGGNRRTLLVATLLVMPAVVGKWSHHLWPSVVPPEFYLFAYLVFLVFVVSRLLHFILRAPRVNSEVLCAGISGYLMLGLLWVIAYMLVARAVPDAFTFTVGPTSHQTMDGFTAFYFSFATLTTIGYGDISPVSNVARMLSVMEAVTGMFYITVLISRLVALSSSRPPASESAGTQDSRCSDDPAGWDGLYSAGKVVNVRAMRLSAVSLALLVVLLAAVTVWAGGSGLNVIVVVNQNSADSVQLGNDYCEKRGVPPQNLLRLTNWAGGAIEWSLADFESALHTPLLAMINARGLTNQAELVVLSMDIPYRILASDPYQSHNGTTSALFYGFKNDVAPPIVCLPACCSLPDASSNSYAFSELPFHEATPNTAPTNSYLAMMLTASNLTSADLILSRGVAGDSSFPTQTVYLAKTSDPARNVRFAEFDNAILATHVRGDNSLVWINSDATSFTNLLGLMTGLALFTLPANAFTNGAIADTLTSYSGQLFEVLDQTCALAFLNAGAAGSYGTVWEPCGYPQKFPNPLAYFYQNRGFSLVEAYYQSLLNPYQGIVVGEPLSAPFARPGAAGWSSLTNGTVLSGQTQLQPAFVSAATNLPFGRVDLFVDGVFAQVMTNLPPAAGNVLTVTLNGTPVNYTVPAGATVPSVAAGLTAVLNAHTNSTHVQAWPVGDRLELQSLDPSVAGSSVPLGASNAVGSAGQLRTFLTPARSTFLDSAVTGYVVVLVSNTPLAGDWLQLVLTKTNGAQVRVNVTNSVAGATVADLTRNLANSINANPALQSADGVIAADSGDDSYCGIVEAQFTLYARSAGWPASQIQVAVTASTNLLAWPVGTNRLQDNLSDLQPRNHVYVSSGATSLAANSDFDTTQFADGFHLLTAVAYEGTSVRTQTRVSRNIQIQNTVLAASIATTLVGTDATLDFPLQFLVTANATNISRIELFSTGGLAGVVSNQPAALFAAPSAMLGLGLHPFYALVTDTVGKRYQTQNISIRLVPSFNLGISKPPLTLTWSAIPGQKYDVLATTNLTTAFQSAATLTATSSLALWPITAPGGAAAFYRVRLSP